MHNFTKTLFSLSLTAATAAQAAPAFSCCATDETHVGRPDEHAPISVMGDHTHAKDGWMVSYRFMQMDMDGMRNGTDRVSAADVFAEGYTVTPESMTMDMHMFGLMYAPTDKLTLMLMANYIETEMDHLINPAAPAMLFNVVGGDTFTTESSGLGDIKVGGLYRFYLEENSKAHFGLSLSLPTGSIDEQDNTPLPGMPPSFPTQQLPAPMQLGSGTFDLLPSVTYVQQFENWSWGTQANAVIRLESENSNDYRLGNVFGLTSWAGYNLNEWVGLNGGLNYTYTSKLKGDQKDIGLVGPAGSSVTTAFGSNYGGERIDAILGVNFYVPSGAFKGQRLAIDLRLPVWQDLNGYQLETDSVLTIGWQAAF
ncbi:MAG: transporter [Opitutaceae bacterium]